MLKNKIYGLFSFKNYRLNEVVKITFANQIKGVCPICLEDKVLTHIQCGHIICHKCSKIIGIQCGLCRERGLVY